jgi:hypothetical protein
MADSSADVDIGGDLSLSQVCSHPFTSALPESDHVRKRVEADPR